MYKPGDLAEMRRLQFMAANYTRLQGLRGLPIGLLALLVALWANVDRGPAPRPFLPYLGFALLAMVGTIFIDRYYQRSCGAVIGAPGGHLQWVLGALGGGAGLLAFILDIRYTLPISLTGLVFAISMLADYFCLVGITRVRYMPYLPLFPTLVALLSISPLLGFDLWWRIFGFRAEILAVVTASGLMILLSSLVSHLYFIQKLPGKVSHGPSV